MLRAVGSRLLTRAAGASRGSRALCTASGDRTWSVYLSGEIHSDWRERIADGIKDRGLPVSLTSPNTSHEYSDDCGVSKHARARAA